MQTIILQILVFQLCFLVVYELLLRKETFFNWNRAYLLITSIVSLVVPFIKLKSFSKVIPSEFLISLPAVILGETKGADPIVTDNIEAALVNNQSVFSIAWIWYAGIVFFTGVLLFKLVKIWRFKQTSNAVQKQGYSIITLKNSEDAFSFLKSIFLGDKIESTQKESILKHEKVHVREKHTIDLLWFELLRIVLWFNPLVYVYQKRITEVHEFIADKSASKHNKNYYENLLAKTFNIAQFSLVNQFYSSSLIKKRIIMLTKEKSNKTKLVKYITVIPIVLAMLVFVSFTDALEAQNTTGTSKNSETTVLEDVITIINRTAFIDNNKDISEELLDIIINDLKQYKKANITKINQAEIDDKIAIMFRHLSGISPEDYEDYMKNNLDLFYFHTGYMFLNNILDKIDSVTNDDIVKKSIKLLAKPKMFNRLKELNYVLPNIDKYAKTGVSIEKGEVNNDYLGQSEVPFSVIDQGPIYPGCDENATLEELKKCFSRSISVHVTKNFNTEIGRILNLKGRQKMIVAFKIDEQGQLIDAKVRAPHPQLVTETKRVLNLLPIMKPGMHKGKRVTVPYSLPIIFEINYNE